MTSSKAGTLLQHKTATPPISLSKKRIPYVHVLMVAVVVIAGLLALYSFDFFHKNVEDAQIRSIAVLPLADLSGDQAHAVSTQVNPASHDAFLLGAYQVSRGRLGPAIEALERAIELDPDNADALAELARIHDIQVWRGPHVKN